MNAIARRLRLRSQIDPFILQTSWEVCNFYWRSNVLRISDFNDMLIGLPIAQKETL
jgi:hypothetical protein